MATRIFSNTATITIQRIPEVNNNRESLTLRKNFKESFFNQDIGNESHIIGLTAWKLVFARMLKQ